MIAVGQELCIGSEECGKHCTHRQNRLAVKEASLPLRFLSSSVQVSGSLPAEKQAL